MKLNLGTKLFLSYLLIILVGLVVLVIVAQFTLPAAYGQHMAMMFQGGGMTLAPGASAGVGNGAVRGQGMGSGGFQNFRSGFYEALGWSGLAAFVVALIASFLFSRGLTSPVKKMTVASQRIAEGHYGERVEGGGGDELGQLAGSFNSMAGKLEQVESMRRRLIGDVAHELRTPLTAIKGSMEGLADGVLPASKQTYEQVEAEADRLSRLVDDLQELSLVESGALSLQLGPVSVCDMAEILEKRLSAAYATREVSLEMDVPGSLPPVHADAERLLQVLTNLLNNALRYTPAGGKVTFSAEPRRQEMLMRVTDTGVGITAEHLPFIFDRFYRVDPSRSRQGGGSGIGLTIAKHLVEAQGGQIWSESAGEGKGSTFFFTIPLEKAL